VPELRVGEIATELPGEKDPDRFDQRGDAHPVPIRVVAKAPLCGLGEQNVQRLPSTGHERDSVQTRVREVGHRLPVDRPAALVDTLRHSFAVFGRTGSDGAWCPRFAAGINASAPKDP